MNIALLIMVKNEEHNIYQTFSSVMHFVDTFVVMDTGSTDKTISKIKDICKDKKLFLFEEPFIDFSTSRNRLLEFAKQTDSKYFLLMDAADEWKGEEPLLEDFDVIMMKHTCRYGGTKISFLRETLVKRDVEAKYILPVHEYLEYSTKNIGYYEGSFVYQERLDPPTRLESDVVILANYLKDNPKNGRAIYYLAQTLFNLQRFDEAFAMYLRRTTIEPKNEESFQSVLKIIELLIRKKDFVNARHFCEFAIKFSRHRRMEPFVLYSKIFRLEGNARMALQYIKIACKFDKPDEGMVNDYVYDDYRWNELERLKSRVG